MTERRLSREAARLRELLGPSVCAHPAPCQTATVSEVRIMPDGSEVRTGAEPRPLCGGCPNREARAVRHVEVRLDCRNRRGGVVAPSAARIAHNGHDEGPEEYGPPQATVAPTAPEPDRGDGMPAAWGPDHPARLALEGREPPPPRRRGDDGTVRVDPSDFGL